MTAVPRPLHHGRSTGAAARGQLPSALHVRDTGMAAVVVASFNCTVAIGPAGGARTFDEGSGQTVTAPAATIYTGPAGIGPASSTGTGTDVVTAEDLVALRIYEVELPHDADTSRIKVDHVVRVISATDPRLAGGRLTVRGFEDADRAWTRVLYALRTDG